MSKFQLAAVTVSSNSKTSPCANVEGIVTVPFLNCYYQITGNAGNVSLSQSVMETMNQYFSPSDLTAFQVWIMRFFASFLEVLLFMVIKLIKKTFGLMVQPAEVMNGHQMNNNESMTSSYSIDEGEIF